MPIIEFQNRSFEVDEEGFLRNFCDWCPEWVDHARASQGIAVLTDEHWELIHTLQQYYKENGFPPLVRSLSKATGFKMKHIFELFPAGPGKGACRLAGLPKPKGCV